jgi:hypothetical protein
MAKTYLRKEQVAARYGNTTKRSIERAAKDGRLPPPVFPLSNGVPYWDEAELDEHDRKVVLRNLHGTYRGAKPEQKVSG